MKLCFTCFGVGHPKGCKGCGRRKKKPDKREQTIREESDAEREKWLRKAWEKAKLFKLQSTGSPQVDAELRRRFGEWL